MSKKDFLGERHTSSFHPQRERKNAARARPFSDGGGTLAVVLKNHVQLALPSGTAPVFDDLYAAIELRSALGAHHRLWGTELSSLVAQIRIALFEIESVHISERTR